MDIYDPIFCIKCNEMITHIYNNNYCGKINCVYNYISPEAESSIYSDESIIEYMDCNFDDEYSEDNLFINLNIILNKLNFEFY